MNETADPEVERAFREWCAIVDVSPSGAVAQGSVRLRRDPQGKFHVEQVVGAHDEVRVVGQAMTGRAFCDAVRFLHDSLAVKTVQVARAAARKKARASERAAQSGREGSRPRGRTRR